MQGVENQAKTYITSLDEVTGNEQVLLVRRDLDVVRSDNGLILLRVVEALDIVQVRNVQSSDVVSEGNCEIGELSIVGDVRVDGGRLLGFVPEVVEKFGNTLVAFGVLAEGIDDPDYEASLAF